MGPRPRRATALLCRVDARADRPGHEAEGRWAGLVGNPAQGQLTADGVPEDVGTGAAGGLAGPVLPLLEQTATAQPPERLMADPELLGVGAEPWRHHRWPHLAALVGGAGWWRGLDRAGGWSWRSKAAPGNSL